MASRDMDEAEEREKLKVLLKNRLIESGWRDELKAHCKQIIKERGVENLTVDDLIEQVTPKGRSLVPDDVKKELLGRIKTFLAQQDASTSN